MGRESQTAAKAPQNQGESPNSKASERPPWDISDLAVLRAVVEGTVHSTGEEFFQSLVRNLATAIDVQYAFVAEFAADNTRVRTLAYWSVDHSHENIEYDLDGTPCEDVVRGKLCHYSRGVREKFPRDLPLVELGIESYLGVPLLDAEGATLGHLAVFDPRPMSEEPSRISIFQIFAARAAAELARLRAERALRESEERYRDLFEEAPIAYVNEDLESRFISANRAALRILGITPEQVPGMIGMSLVVDTPDAQQRVRDIFATIGRGADTAGVVLELRRKDNGNPVWIQWWSKPDSSGSYTRTMFVDITDRVLMEQEKARLTAQNVYLQEEIKSVHNFDEIVGQSPSILAVLDSLRLVAPTEASVLIYGETGTGKELIARAIHSVSHRNDKPLIKVNCAALPTGLIESELFGHEKGAFTGAISRRIGRFELADGGTIFLDEIGELPLDAQSKLLRVLQEREFERVGGSASLKVDVRIIAATNRDLLKSVRERTFREDLYYRLSVFPLTLPPLRERRDDIPLLVHFLVNKFATRIGKKIESVSRQAIDRLMAYDWPGNIRELENIIERAVIVAPGSMLEITSDTLVPSRTDNADEGESLRLEDIEKQHIVSVLKKTDWVIDGPRGAALVLNLHPNTLRSRMKKLGISRGG